MEDREDPGKLQTEDKEQGELYGDQLFRGR